MDPPVFWCPLRGKSAAPDSWWTKRQVEYQQEFIAGPAHDYVVDELQKAFKPRRDSFLKFEVRPAKRPETPDPLAEPDDMAMISPPCHPWEPVKVPDDAVAPFFCLLRGEPYAA